MARHLAGMDEAALAGAANCSPASVERYELGLAVPPDGLLARIARTLDVPAEFLAPGRPRLRLDTANAHFRPGSGTADRRRALARVELLWEAINELEQVVELPPVRLTRGGNPAAVARIVRRDWGIESGPVVHLVRMLECQGIAVAHLEQPDLGAFSVHLPGRPVIVLTARDDPRRRRFALAHELGHLLLHPQPEPGNARHEAEADAFAAELLMPAAELANRISTAADWFGVTPAAVADRARSLGLRPVTRAAVEHREFPGEEPELLARAARFASVTALAARLGTRPARLRELLGLPGPRLRALS